MAPHKHDQVGAALIFCGLVAIPTGFTMAIGTGWGVVSFGCLALLIGAGNLIRADKLREEGR